MAPTQTTLTHLGIMRYHANPQTPPPSPDADQFQPRDKLAPSRFWHQSASDAYHEDASGIFLSRMRLASDASSPLSETPRTSPFEGHCPQRSARSPKDSHYRRGPWSSSEDDQLIMLVRKNGASNWVHISNRMGRRTPKQCRERYHQNLKPTLNRNQITDEEGQEILRHVAEIGKQWAEIARRMHDRSDNAVKNWWNGYENRRKRTERRNALAKQASTSSSSSSPSSSSSSSPSSSTHASSLSIDSTASSPQQEHYPYKYQYHHHRHYQEHLDQAAAQDPRMRIDALLC